MVPFNVRICISLYNLNNKVLYPNITVLESTLEISLDESSSRYLLTGTRRSTLKICEIQIWSRNENARHYGKKMPFFLAYLDSESKIMGKINA